MQSFRMKTRDPCVLRVQSGGMTRSISQAGAAMLACRKFVLTPWKVLHRAICCQLINVRRFKSAAPVKDAPYVR